MGGPGAERFFCWVLSRVLLIWSPGTTTTRQLCLPWHNLILPTFIVHAKDFQCHTLSPTEGVGEAHCLCAIGAQIAPKLKWKCWDYLNDSSVRSVKWLKNPSLRTLQVLPDFLEKNKVWHSCHLNPKGVYCHGCRKRQGCCWGERSW